MRRRRPLGLLRLLLVAVAALLLACVSLALTFVNGAGRKAPQWALKLGTGNAGVEAAAAAELLLQPRLDRPTLARARSLAISALEREPVNVPAIRTLGLIAAAQGDRRDERLFAYSERLSRRDEVTQLWLIESAVRRDSIPDALRHYDRVLRTSVESRDLLFPILSRAAGEPAIADSLVVLLAQRPPWWAWFLNTLTIDPQSSSEALVRIVPRLRLRVSNEVDRQILERTLARLVRDGAYGPAFSIYRASLPRGDDPDALVRNGDFERQSMLPPFDWSFVDEPDLGAVRDRLSGREGTVVQLVASSGRSGEVARQLLVLPSGRYDLSLMVGGVAGDTTTRPSIAITCVANGAHPLQLRLPVAPSSGSPVSGSFAIPVGGCPAQWLTISAAASEDAEGYPWIDKLSLRPI